MSRPVFQSVLCWGISGLLWLGLTAPPPSLSLALQETAPEAAPSGPAPVAEAASAAEQPATSSPAQEPAPAAAAPPPEATSTSPGDTAPSQQAEPATEPEPPSPDYTRLAEPAVVEQLKLSAEQQARIAELLKERSETLAAAEEAARPKTIEQSDKKLAGVLTDEQRTAFAAGTRVPRLRFQFRFQRWEQVLDWLAQQADLSLVLDAPPPGTFNYTDTREYSPTEAIDLVNSWLLTKGYVLVRRDRMLLLLDLRNEIPHSLIPRLSPEEAATRGKHELVTVEFSLGRRPAEQVTAAVKTLLGTFGQVTVVPGTQRLLVTDRAGVMAAVGQLIQSLPEPTPSPPRPEPPKPESPELRVYPVSKADPKVAAEVIKALLPSAQIVLDAKLNQINAHATPSQHRAIETVLQKMESEEAASRQARLELYPLPAALSADELSAALQMVAPEAMVRADSENAQVAVWARPEDHQKIQSALEKYGGGTALETTAQLEAYPITRADPTTLLPLLEKVAPRARISYDAQSRKLLVLAVPSDQQLVRATLDQLQPSQAGPDSPELRLYQLQQVPAAQLAALLADLVPAAQVTADEENRRLMVIASPGEHEAIKKAVEQADAALLPDTQRQFRAYALRGIELSSRNGETLFSQLQSLVPGARITYDSHTSKVLAYATPKEHELIGAALEKLVKGATPQTAPTVEVYPITRADPQATLKMLQQLVPDAQLSIEASSGNLAALATAEEHATIKATLEKLEPSGSGPQTPELRIYELKQAAPASLLSLLRSLAPKAEVTEEAAGRRLLVTAPAADHEVIRGAIDKFLQSVQPEENQLVVYPVSPAQRTRFQAILASISAELPGIQVITDAVPGELAVWARPEQHRVIAEILDQLKKGLRQEESYRLEGYSIRVADPSSVLQTLAQLYPNTKIVLDANTQRLLVWTSPEEHDSIRATLERIDTEAPPDEQPRFEVYPVHGALASTIVSNLQSLVPNVKLTLDATANRLLAWGTPAEHERIRTALDKLGQGGKPEHMPQLEVYPLGKLNTSSVVSLLQTLVPDAKLTVDSTFGNLVALAIAGDQALIRATLDELQTKRRGPEAPELRYYPFTVEPSQSLLAALANLVPDAQVTVDKENHRLLVVASPADHQVVKATLEQFEASTPPEEPKQLVVYRVTPTERKRFEALLPNLDKQLPGVQVLEEVHPGELAVWAQPTQHEVIRQIVEQLKQEAGPKEEYQLVGYQITSADPDSVLQVMQTLFPDVQFVLDKKAKRLMAWAAAATQEKVKAAFEQIDSGTPGQWQQQLRVYPLTKADPSVALQMLQQLVPEVKLSSDPRAGTIIAWATAAEHRQIEETLQQLEAGPPEGKKPHVVVYPTDKIDASSLALLLRTVVPKATVAVDSKTGGLAVWAAPEEHQAVREAIAELSKEEVASQAPALKTYTVKETTAASVLGTLAQAVPGARLSVGTDPHQLVAWARPAEHEMIEAVLKQLAQEEPPETAPRLETYTVEATTATNALAVLRLLAPEAVFTVGNDPQQLIVWARPKDHDKVRHAIEQLGKQAEGGSQLELAIYNLKYTTASSAMQALRMVVPQAQLSSGSDTKQLVAWARPGDHQKIAATLERIDVKRPEESVPRIYTVERMGQSSYYGYYLIRFLSEAVPQAQFITGADSSQIIAWARPEEHERIAQLIEQLTSRAPPDKAPRAIVYTLQSITASSAMAVLREAVPRASLTPDSANPQRLTVWATPAEHAVVDEVLKQIDVETDSAAQYTVQLYTVEGVSPSYAMQWLRELVPQARFTSGTDAQQLVVWARAEDHGKISNALKELAAAGQAEQRTAQVYRLQWITAATAVQILGQAVPNARITQGTEPGQLIAWARPDDHQSIDKVLKQIDVEDSGTTAAQSVVYPLEGMSLTAAIYAVRLLQSAVPAATFTLANDGSRLVAWAKPNEHQRIRQIVEQLTAEEPAETAPTIELYTLPQANVQAALSLLGQLVPAARLAAGSEPGQLVAWARPRDHRTIVAAIEKLSQDVSSENAPTVATYPLRSIDAVSAVRLLTTAFRDAQFTPSSDGRSVIAFASPGDHRRIGQAIESMAEPAGEQAPVAQVYAVQGTTTAAQAIELLRQAFPQARFSPGGDPQQLLVYATAAEHERIAEAVERLSQQESEKTQPYVATYELRSVSFTTAAQALRAAVPQAKLSPGAKPNQLVAWARPADHQILRQIVDEMNKRGAEPAERAVGYTLIGTPASNVIPMLQQAVPEARFIVGSDPYRLIAWATEEGHETIARSIEQLAREESAVTAPTLSIYDLGTAQASQVIPVLLAAAPGAKFAVGSRPSQLLAWARPEDHRLIGQAVEELQAAGPLGGDRIMSVYPIPSGDAKTLLQLLDPALREHAQFVVDGNRNSLIVWAERKYHDDISRAIEEYLQGLAGAQQMTSRVYRFRYADPTAALAVLRSLVPGAQIALDQVNMSLVVSALAEDHAKIEATIREMDREDAEGLRPVLRVHRVTSADPFNVYSNLRQLFRYDSAVQLSVDEANDSIVAIASAAKHETIAKLIEEIERGVELDTAANLRMYPLKNIDVDAAMGVIKGLMQKRGSRVEMSVEPRSNQLVVIARPDQHKIIEETLQQLRSEDTELEILQLEEVDPYSAQTAIERMFADEPYPPGVDVDFSTQQLIVRATAEQYERIVELLVKMGETRLAVLRALGSRAVRVVPFDGDLEATLKEVQRLWPDLRQNRIQVITLDQLRQQSATTEPAAGTEPKAPKAPKPQSGETPQPRVPAGSEKPAAHPAEPARPQPTEPAKAAEAQPAPASTPPEQDATTVVIYRLDRPLAAQAVEVLRTQLPRARFAEGLEPNQVVAWARTSEHERVRELLAELTAAAEQQTQTAQQPKTEAEKPPQDRPQQPQPHAEPDQPQPAPAGKSFPAGKEPAASKEPSRTSGAADGKPNDGSSSDGPAAEKPAAEAKPDEETQAAAAVRWRIVARVVAGDPNQASVPGSEVVEPAEASAAASAGESSSGGEAGGSATPAESHPAEQPAEPSREELPPVYIVPGEGTLTIVSDDPQALEQLEGLLLAISGQRGAAGRNITIYELRYSNAALVAEKLREFLRVSYFGGYGRRYGSLVIVPDEQRNSLLVQASRTDRSTIEELLKILDSPELPEAIASNKPRLIAIKNADAEDIRDVIQTIFRARLTPVTVEGGSYGYSSYRSSRAPSPLTPQLTVDQATNSLVVTGPPQLVEQIAELARMLDEAAANQPARQVKIIPLQKANAERIEEALQRVMRSRSSYYYRRSR